MDKRSDEESDEDVDVTISESSSCQDIDVINLDRTESQILRRTGSVLRLPVLEEVNRRPTGLMKRGLALEGGPPEAKRGRPEAAREPPPPTADPPRLEDFHGYPEVLSRARRYVHHFKEAQIYRRLGTSPPFGLLIHGPPGTGKTHLAKAIASKVSIHVSQMSAHDFNTFGMHSRLRQTILAAILDQPSAIIVDDLEAVTENKEHSKKLLRTLDEMRKGVESGESVFFVGVTSSPACMDHTLRKCFDREISIDLPGPCSRLQILRHLTSSVNLGEDVSLQNLTEITPGFVAADLKRLISEAAAVAIDRAIDRKQQASKAENFVSAEGPTLTNDDINSISIRMNDLQLASKTIKLSTQKVGTPKIPEITWDDIGSLKDVKNRLKTSILFPVTHWEQYNRLGLKKPTGVLLFGPPGCGKTLLAKAIANEASLNFISVKGPELLSSYVGESERAVREVFKRAEEARPCVLFLDEVDALCPRRSGGESSHVSSRVVNQILTEMDGVEEREGVFLLAATNRPDILDPALLRPGRFDHLLYVGLPTAEDRAEILRALTRGRPLDPSVRLEELGQDCRLEGFSGADLGHLVREATVLALIEHLEGRRPALLITGELIGRVLAGLRPSVRPEELAAYRAMRASYVSSSPSPASDTGRRSVSKTRNKPSRK